MTLIIETPFDRHRREQIDRITIRSFRTARRRVLKVECTVELGDEVDEKPGVEVLVPDEVAVAEGAGVGGDVGGSLGRRVFGPVFARPVGVFGLVGWMGDGGASDVDGFGLVDGGEEEDVVLLGSSGAGECAVGDFFGVE